MIKCFFDDNKAVARVWSDDGKHISPICLEHLLQFLSEGTEIKFKLMRGKKLPPKPNPSLKHKWNRLYLVGMEGEWQCEICKLKIFRKGPFPPSEYAYGGCIGKEVDWKELGYE